MTQRVVVTGIGAVSPVGNDAVATWGALTQGTSGIGPITRFDASGDKTRIAGEVHGFDPADYLDRKRQRRSARFSQFAVAAAREAARDAGLAGAPGTGLDGADPARAGVVVNTAVTGFPEIQEAVETLHGRGAQRVSPYFVSSVIPNMPACEVAIDLGLHGPVTAGSLACASGVYALVEARRLIVAGEADVVIAGGTDAGISPVMFAGLTNMGALSRRNDEPERASRPFDADRDGFVFGEGAALLVLESAEHAHARGAAPYAELAGGALTSDAFHVSAPEPSGEYAAAAIRHALDRTGTTPADIDYVCAHGTSTKINDVTETRAIRDALGPRADNVAVSSPKSMVGHMIGAAGSLSAMVCALAVRDGLVPPTINLDTPDPECDLDYVPNKSRPMRVRAALVNAFGFGGQNCVAVLREP